MAPARWSSWVNGTCGPLAARRASLVDEVLRDHGHRKGVGHRNGRTPGTRGDQDERPSTKLNAWTIEHLDRGNSRVDDPILADAAPRRTART